MSLEITGVLERKYDTQHVSDKFKRREFVLKLDEEINGKLYTNFAKFQLVQNKCDIIDRVNEGDTLKVNFNVKGNRWEKDGKVNYITNLDAWRVEVLASAPVKLNVSESHFNAPKNTGYTQAEVIEDDLPFNRKNINLNLIN